MLDLNIEYPLGTEFYAMQHNKPTLAIVSQYNIIVTSQPRGDSWYNKIFGQKNTLPHSTYFRYIVHFENGHIQEGQISKGLKGEKYINNIQLFSSLDELKSTVFNSK